MSKNESWHPCPRSIAQFPTADITDGILTNCLRHEWFFAANDAVVRKAAADLGGKEYINLLRALKPGERLVKDRDAGVFQEYVPLLEDPWGFPGLAEKKATLALEEIKKRPEYRLPQMSGSGFGDVSRPAADDLNTSSHLPPTDDNPNLGI